MVEGLSLKNETLDPDIPRRSYKVPSRFDYFLNNSARHSTLIVQIWIVSSAVIQERSFSRQQPFRPSNGRFLTPTLQLRKWHQAFHAIHDSKYKEQIDDSQLKCEGKKWMKFNIQSAWSCAIGDLFDAHESTRVAIWRAGNTHCNRGHRWRLEMINRRWILFWQSAGCSKKKKISRTPSEAWWETFCSIENYIFVSNFFIAHLKHYCNFGKIFSLIILISQLTRSELNFYYNLTVLFFTGQKKNFVALNSWRVS